jgi:hypothetical protein
MRRIGLLLSLVLTVSLIATPGLAKPPDRTGNLRPPRVVEQRVSLLPCPDTIYVGPDEPFNIHNGFNEQIKIGRYRFVLAVNGEVQPSKSYNVVHHSDDGPLTITRWFVSEFPNGLVDGDVVEGSFYDPDGFVDELYCSTTITIGDPPE